MRAGVALAAMVAAGLWATPASAEAPAPPPIPGRTITLISGDRLQVAPDGRSANRLPASGRDSVALLSRMVDGHLSVVPEDAVTLLNADRLDPRLFDVTGLLDAGYDTRGNLPLIITGADRAAVGAAAGGPVQTLDPVNGSAVRVSTARIATMWAGLTTGDLRSGYRKVWLDGAARISTDVSVPLVGAPAAWAQGYTGGEVPVGVLDTGVDTDHPDLAGAVAETVDFTEAGDGVDRVGHGTQVASVIAGSGAASGGRYRGMAPDARIYSAKVCASTLCAESAIIEGMAWAARDKGLKVVNLSLGHPDQPGADLLEEAVDTLTARYGTLFVVAGGNDGGRVSSPASAEAALTVGAGTIGDKVAGFSNQGPRSGDDGLKPDLVAPGVNIVAARSGDSKLPAIGPRGAYARQSGTSMAAPHVTGAAAIVAQEHPEWSPARIKAALMSTATPIADAPVDRAGTGRLDVARAVTSPVTADPASLSFGSQAAPRTVTYHNSGSSAVTLALSSSNSVFVVDDQTVTVPARGEATVIVTADIAKGRATGALTAASAGFSVRTTLGAERLDTHTLTVHYTDRTGARTGRAFGSAHAEGTDAVLPGGTVRLPAGTYTVDAKVFEASGQVTLLNQPKLVLDRDITVEMDARLGRPVAVAAPRAGARQVWANISVTTGGTGLQDDTFEGMATAQIGGGLPGLRTDVAATWAEPGGLYSLAWFVEDQFVTGFTRTVDPAALAVVRADYRAAGLMQRPYGPHGSGYISAIDRPSRRTEYFNTDGDVVWGSLFSSGGTISAGPFGRATTGSETWNDGVPGPALPASAPWGNGVTRTGNTLVVNPSWLAGGSGDRAGIATRNHTVVTRDGEVLSDSSSPAVSLTVPAASGEYTVMNDSTKWTFRSRRGQPVAIPVVRFTPRAGNVLAFAVRHQAGGNTADLSLRVSYDDGKTWAKPLSSRVGDRGVAFLRPPAGEGFVSLKTSAVDGAGNTVEQTLIRAYAW